MKGGSISNNLLYAGLDLILMDERCQTRGFVLDGMPSSQEEFDILQRRSIVPFRIIELEVSHKEVKFRNEAIIEEKRKLKTQLEMARLLPKPEGEEEEEDVMEDDDEEEEDEGLPKVKLASYLIPLEDDYEATDHEEILEKYYQAYISNIEPIRTTYSQLYRNWMAINARQNRWKIWTDLFNFMTEATFKMQRYMKSIRDDNIAQLDGICITPNEYEKRKGHFGDYCPVSFVLRDELVDCQNQEGMRFCVEYNRKYYRVSGSRELDFILAEPSKYLNDSVQLPKHLPRSITAEESHEWLKKNGEAEIKGFCAVSYKDGNFAYEALTRGSENIAAIHMRKCFLFVSEKHKKKFMLHPDKYINLSLPSKLPPKPVHIPFTSLPIGGYLEQGISKLFIEAIDAVGRKKPKFPFTSVTQSALLFVSIYLKASNPNMTEYTRMKWTEILDQFNNDCDNISFLGRKMTRRYRAPSQRLPELDTRLARFFNLKQKPEYMRKITS
jgi:adenylate/nucleoside-diphosphate kinase